MNNTKDQIAVRDNAANQILNLITELDKQLQDLSIRINNKLEPISRHLMPCTAEEPKEKEEEEMPSYFAKLHEHLHSIRNNIYNIYNSIDRLEI